MLGLRIKELRKSKKLTQKQLSEKINVDCSSVTKWETGKANPDFEKQKMLADLFDVSIDYLLGRTDTADLLYKTAEEKCYLDKFLALSLEEKKQLFKTALPEQEQYLISSFRSLDEQGKDYILDTINLAKLKYSVQDEPSLRIAAAPDITPAKIDTEQDEVSHS